MDSGLADDSGFGLEFSVPLFCLDPVSVAAGLALELAAEEGVSALGSDFASLAGASGFGFESVRDPDSFAGASLLAPESFPDDSALPADWLDDASALELDSFPDLSFLGLDSFADPSVLFLGCRFLSGFFSVAEAASFAESVRSLPLTCLSSLLAPASRVLPERDDASSLPDFFAASLLPCASV